MAPGGMLQSRRWTGPGQPLYLAMAFQVAAVACALSDYAYTAAGPVFGTVACILTSLRLQGQSVHGTQEG